jgi:hypothetical protein
MIGEDRLQFLHANKRVSTSDQPDDTQYMRREYADVRSVLEGRRLVLGQVNKPGDPASLLIGWTQLYCPRVGSCEACQADEQWTG